MTYRLTQALTFGLCVSLLACEKSADSPASDAGAPIAIVFEVYDGVMGESAGYRAKLRVKTTLGQTFEYKAPVSHGSCYLLANMTSAAHSGDVVDGDEAHLICSGGGQTDHATVTRTSDTRVEITVFQKAFEGPDTPPSKPEHAQTFALTVPKGATLRTRFEAATPR